MFKDYLVVIGVLIIAALLGWYAWEVANSVSLQVWASPQSI